ncbi:PAS domain-containing protein [Caldimonas taiwanensis]|uniref:PAS domain-containing protein n=1 Tax=Caldimonas taiwanensis TaxID=307483 RepID=UPI000780914F|nr:PAS domain-containing protein [Caldimonas taiwanensis]
MKLSLKLKVALIATTAVVALAALVGWQQDRRLAEDFRAVLAEQQDALAESMADHLGDKLHTYLTVLESAAAQLDEAVLTDAEARQRFVSRPSPLKSLFDGLAIVDLQGDLITNEPPLPPGHRINVADREYFRRALAEQRSLVSEPVQARTGAGPAVLLVVPVKDRQQRLQALLVGGLRLLRSNLLGLMAQAPVGRTGHFEIVTRGAPPVYVIHPDPARILQPADASASRSDGAVITRKLIALADWELRVVLPGWEVAAPVREAQRTLLKELGLYALGAAALSWLLLRWLLQPLTTLHRAIHKLRRDPQAQVRLDTRSRDERGDLARDFKALLDELRMRQQELHVLMQAAPLGLFRANTQGDIVYANEAYLRIHRLQAQDMARGWLSLLPESQREAAWTAWQRIVQAAQAWHMVRTLQGPDGRPLMLSVHCAPLFEDGQPAGMVGTVEDITEQVQAQDALRTLTSIFDHTADYVLQTNPQGQITYLNPAARRKLGLRLDQPLDGLHYAQFNTQQTNELIAREVLPAVRRDGLWLGETSFYDAAGAEVRVSHLVLAHRDPQGRITHFSGVLRDITAEAAARQEVQRQAATLRSVAEHLPVIVGVVGGDGRYRYVNRAYERWLGRPAEHIVGRPLAEVLGPQEYARSQPWVERVLAGETVSFEKDFPERRTHRHLSIHFIPLRLDDGRIDGFVGMAQDISEQRQETLRLLNLAHTDPLTGVLNRAGFEAALARHAAQGTRLAVLYLDLDRFKPVNDEHGHPVGDELLRLFAARLARLVRPSDTVARLGGDEFAVLLPGIDRIEQAQAVADKVLEAAHQPFTVGQLRLHIGASVGIAWGVPGPDGGRALVAQADAQLYRAKQEGRGRYAAAAAAA